MGLRLCPWSTQSTDCKKGAPHLAEQQSIFGVLTSTRCLAHEARCETDCECRLCQTPRDFAKPGKSFKSWGNQCLPVHAFQLAKLVWPPLVLWDLHRLMSGSEKSFRQNSMRCASGKKPLIESLVWQSASALSLWIPGRKSTSS